MLESDLREILGDERYNDLVKCTCGVCGKMQKDNLFLIDCSHSLCIDCSKTKLLPLPKDEEENPSIYYHCKICDKTSKLKAVVLDKHKHSIRIVYLFLKVFSDPNFALNADPANLRIGDLLGVI